MEITLKTLHVGEQRRVVTLSIDDRDEITPFLENVERDQKQAFTQLKACLRVITHRQHYQNEKKFKNLGGGLYEIKTRTGVRVYTFLDKLESVSDQQLIITACGGGKNTKKQQNRDIERARALREKYLNAKKRADTRLKFVLHPSES